MRALIAFVLLGCSSSEDAPSTTTTDSSVTDTATSSDTGSAMDTAVADSAMTETAPTETAAPDTWESWAKGFFATYCVECHGATSTTRRYTLLDDVKRDSVKIKCGTAAVKLAGCGSFPPPKQFPIDNATKSNPKPSDAERARLVAWIEAGTP